MAVLPWLLVALMVGAVALEPPPREDPRPQSPLVSLLPTFRPADGLGSVVTGWGDAWMEDRRRGRVLRVDGATGRVLAAIPVAGRVSLAAGAGALWALQSSGGYARERRGPLLRIDPATNRVAAQVPLRTPGGRMMLGFGVLTAPGALYVWGPRDVLRVDPVAARVVGAVRVGDARGELTGMVLRGEELIGTTADGHVVRLNARTGRETGASTLPLAGGELTLARGEVVLAAEGTVAALDAATGRLAWRRRLGFRIGGVVAAGGVLWAQSSALADPGDRLWALDPRTGRPLGSGLLPVFGTMGLAAVNGGLWVTSPGGTVVVLPRWLASRLARP